MSSKVFHAAGKRKTAIARATIKPGKGKIRVNNMLLDSYGSQFTRMRIMEPLLIAGDLAKSVDINVSVAGGGAITQAGAARLAIGKCLAQYDKKLEKELLNYDRTLLVADVRRKETHKPNRHGKARAKRQKSYR